MSGITYDYMEQYIRSLIPAQKGILGNLQQYAIENGVPIVQKEVANFLQLMMNLKKPKKILELGTAIGYSAILMLESYAGISEVVTIERDPKMIEIAKLNFKQHGLEKKVTLLEGDCLDCLEKLEGQFDFIFMDAGKGHYNHFLPHCLRLLSPEGTIVADNVLFRGMVASKELLIRRKITIVKRMKNYLEMVSNHPDLITSVIPMGDGIAITVRRNGND